MRVLWGAGEADKKGQRCEIETTGDHVHAPARLPLMTSMGIHWPKTRRLPSIWPRGIKESERVLPSSDCVTRVDQKKRRAEAGAKRQKGVVSGHSLEKMDVLEID